MESKLKLLIVKFLEMEMLKYEASKVSRFVNNKSFIKCLNLHSNKNTKWRPQGIIIFGPII
ncbi:hypothetical protein BpHYR1_027533 [Brachionus plicatilis]|uniref:Uncharacterized protein n=1 Tax=Brachionus plicatilis TaxID=10195 RepID=A0A3M7SNY0_BRAPC|nr:hypothetical protein BpHYR1_027533 [Brachionus plicatilis]